MNAKLHFLSVFEMTWSIPTLLHGENINYPRLWLIYIEKRIFNSKHKHVYALNGLTNEMVANINAMKDLNTL